MLAGDIIITRLGAVAGVYSLIGGSAPNDGNARIFKFWAPEQPTLPCIVYKLNATERLKGTYGDPGYNKATVQIVAIAADPDGADALAEQIRLALERFGSNQPAGIPYAGTTLYDITVGSQAEGYDFSAEVFFVSCDYTVEHLETTP